MTQSGTQQGTQAIEAEIIEVDSNSSSNSSSKRSDSSSKPSNFPCSKLEASKHLPISDVTVGKYLSALTDAGIRDEGSKVTATDFHHLSQMTAYKERGDSPFDYVSLMTPGDEPVIEPEVMSVDPNGYSMIVSQKQDHLAVAGARLDLQQQQAMDALIAIANAKKQEQAIKAQAQQNKRKQWDLEIVQDLAEEMDYKAKREQELRQKLGI